MGPTGETVTFPLPEHFLPKAPLSAKETKAFRASANELLARTLEQEMAFRGPEQGRLEKTQWKPFRSRDRLRVYKRRSLGQQLAATPMVLGVGQIEGRIEDVLSGLHYKTSVEMRLATSFMNPRHVDAAVLHTIDSRTNEDPFRSLAIKWRVTETPGGNLIKNRDVCVLDYTGTQVDAKGVPFGFHMLQSIEVPWFPALPDPHIIRARIMLCSIFRQRDATSVDCYMKGAFDLGGDLMELVAYETASDALFTLVRAVDCANAKKLTRQLIAQQQRQLQTFGRRVESAGDPLVPTGETFCAVCHKKRRALSANWNHCRLCQGFACAKCLIKRPVFARPRNFDVVCCKPCVIASRARDTAPREPFPMISSLVSGQQAMVMKK